MVNYALKLRRLYDEAEPPQKGAGQQGRIGKPHPDSGGHADGGTERGLGNDGLNIGGSTGEFVVHAGPHLSCSQYESFVGQEGAAEKETPSTPLRP